ncbi:hypothetical protein DFJ73DRAFT_902316 [Zopfochytrium polystomum]|nr:hypothetical protein DFJ73DRAFT_902316 [Zopfochytrium polystomum]
MAGAGPSSPAPPLVVAVILDYLTNARDRMHLATLYRLEHRQAEALPRQLPPSSDHTHRDDPIHSTLYNLSGADAPTWIPPRKNAPPPPPHKPSTPTRLASPALEAASARSDPAMLDFLLKHAIACLRGPRAGTGRCLRGGHRGLMLTMVVTMMFPARVAAERWPRGRRQRWWRLESVKAGSRSSGLSPDGGGDYDTWSDRRIVQRAMELAATHGQLAVLQWWWDVWIGPLWPRFSGCASAGSCWTAQRVRWIAEHERTHGDCGVVLRDLAGCGGDRDGHPPKR